MANPISPMLIVFIALSLMLSHVFHLHTKIVALESQNNLTKHRLQDYKKMTDTTIETLTKNIDILQDAYSETAIYLAAVENVALKTQRAFIEAFNTELEVEEQPEDTAEKPEDTASQQSKMQGEH